MGRHLPRAPGSTRRLGALIGVLVLVLGLVPGTAAGHTPEEAAAERRDQIDEQIASIAASHDHAAAEEARLLAALEVTQAKQSEIDAKLASLGAQVGKLRSAIGAAEARIVQAEADIRVAEFRLNEARDALRRARRDFESQVIDLYTGANISEFFETVATFGQTDDLTQLQLTIGYSDSVVSWRRSSVESHTHLVEEIDALSTHLADAKAAAEIERNNLVVQKKALDLALDEQQHAHDDLEFEIEAQNDIVAELRAQQAQYEARIATLEAESQEIEAELARRAEEERRRREEEARRRAEEARRAQEAGGTTSSTIERPPSGEGRPSLPLQYPVPGAPITSGYGYRTHPIYGTRRMHTGIDIGADTGRPILAAADGEVVSAGSRGGYGLATVIDHGGGLATLYAHQSQLAVSAGDFVARGDVIGYVGSTGFSTGPHLHFEVREDGSPVDPMPYL